MKNEIRIGLLTVSEAGRILGVGATRVRQLARLASCPPFARLGAPVSFARTTLRD